MRSAYSAPSVKEITIVAPVAMSQSALLIPECGLDNPGRITKLFARDIGDFIAQDKNTANYTALVQMNNVKVFSSENSFAQANVTLEVSGNQVTANYQAISQNDTIRMADNSIGFVEMTDNSYSIAANQQFQAYATGCVNADCGKGIVSSDNIKTEGSIERLASALSIEATASKIDTFELTKLSINRKIRREGSCNID